MKYLFHQHLKTIESPEIVCIKLQHFGIAFHNFRKLHLGRLRIIQDL